MKKSAGILMYRFNNRKLQVLLIHPGGPFFKNKDAGAWSIPKGEIADNEDPLTTAMREFKEELGFELNGEMTPLSPVMQKGGKTVYAWAIEGEIQTENILCNTFCIEWPPRSGIMQDFPEIDKAEWFAINVARSKINLAQVSFIEELESILGLQE